MNNLGELNIMVLLAGAGLLLNIYILIFFFRMCNDVKAIREHLERNDLFK